MPKPLSIIGVPSSPGAYAPGQEKAPAAFRKAGRRHVGLTFAQAMTAIEVFVGAPNWTALTVAEVNPDHGAEDGSTMRAFAGALADALGRSPVLA